MKLLVLLHNQLLKELVNGSIVRLKSDGYSDDDATMGVSGTTRSERLTAVVHRHRRAEMGGAECEWSRSPYCCLSFSALHRLCSLVV